VQGPLRDHCACQVRHGLSPGAGSLDSGESPSRSSRTVEAGLGICNSMVGQLHCLKILDPNTNNGRDLRSREVDGFGSSVWRLSTGALTIWQGMPRCLIVV
jgi:hypothetical protein